MTAPVVQYPAVVRVSDIPVTDFTRKFKALRRPAVLVDAADHWPARSLWSFDFFKERYGETEVSCSQYDGRWYKASEAVRMRLNDFIDGLLCRDWQSFPYYIRDYWELFEHHRELVDHCPSPKYFFDWLSRMPAFMQRPGPRLFIGPKGAVTPLHTDIWGTHAWLTQVVGRKRWILIPPSQEHLLGQRISQRGKLARYGVDPISPDFDRFPEFRRATPIECTLRPGETIFVPGGWFHHVCSLDAGISVTWNFMGPGCFYPVLPNAVWNLGMKRAFQLFTPNR